MVCIYVSIIYLIGRIKSEQANSVIRIIQIRDYNIISIVREHVVAHLHNCVGVTSIV